MTWFLKITAILFLALGAALMFLPFPPVLEGERAQETVHLVVEPAPFTGESARAQFGDSFVELSYEGMDGYPGVRETILAFMGNSSSGCVPSTEWESLLSARSVADPEGLVYAFRDDLHRISNVEEQDLGPDGTYVCFDAAFLGYFDDPDWISIARPDPGGFDAHPEIKAELERLAAAPTVADGGGNISPLEWRRFQKSVLDNREFRASFVAYDRLFFGSVREEPIPWSLKMVWLRQVAGAAGAIALLFGTVLAVRSYRVILARPGIAVSSPWLSVFCDVISLGGAVFFVAVAVDTLWVGPLRQPSLLGLEPEWVGSSPITGLHFVSVLAVFFALPLLTLYFTSLSAQRIQIDGDGVISHGAIGSMSISWRDLDHVNLREQKNPFAFTVVDFRKLQKVLELEGEEGFIAINEPSSRKRKREIVNALRRFVPEDKRDLFENVEVEW